MLGVLAIEYGLRIPICDTLVELAAGFRGAACGVRQARRLEAAEGRRKEEVMAENPPRRERPEQEKERERKERMHTVAVATATDAKRHAPPEPPPAKQDMAEVALERTPSGFRWKEIRGENTYREQPCTGIELAKLLRDLADEIDPPSAAGK